MAGPGRRQPRAFTPSQFTSGPVTAEGKNGRPIVIIDERGVLDLRRLSRALGSVDRDLRKELSQANKRAATIIADETKRLMSSGGDARYTGSEAMMRRASKTVRSRASARKVAVVIGADPGKTPEFANAVFWGKSTDGPTDGRTGWFADDQFSGWDAGHQGYAEWVGQSWNDLASGDGPYFLSPAVAAKAREVMDTFERGVQDVMARAGFI